MSVLLSHCYRLLYALGRQYSWPKHTENLRLLKGSVGTRGPSRRVVLDRGRIWSSLSTTGSVPSLQKLGAFGNNLVTLGSTIAYIYLHHLYNNWGVNSVTQQGYLALGRSLHASLWFVSNTTWSHLLWLERNVMVNEQFILGFMAPLVRDSHSALSWLCGVASPNIFISVMLIVVTDLRTL
jgi:hypothetical protein